jgi:uncharacterized protein YpuA (DUF1002 family)
MTRNSSNSKNIFQIFSDFKRQYNCKKYPTNEQIDQVVLFFLNNHEIKTAFQKGGFKAIEFYNDLCKLLDFMRKFIRTVNNENILQKMVLYN